MKHLVWVVIAAMVGCNQTGMNEGDLYFESGDYQKAVGAYTDALTTDPSNEQYLYNRGRSNEELRKYALALEDFLKVVKINPKNANAYLSLSKVSYEMKDYSKALLYAGSAVKFNENSSKAHFLSARAAHQLGYADQALDHYNDAISIDKSYGEAYLYRGALKIGKKRAGSACEDFKRARALDVSAAAKAIKEYCS